MTRKGFTLLEVLLAVTLFATGVVMVTGLFSTGLISSVDPEMTGIAMALAELFSLIKA